MDQPPVRLMSPAPAVGPRRSQHLRRSKSRGQALAEFAIVLPVFMLIVGGIIQFGIIFWGQNTLTQIARDTGRWAATQQTTCGTSAAVTDVADEANAIAAQSALIGYSGASSLNVTVNWQTTPSTDPCPPANNQQTSWVTITLEHQVPIFFPWVPGNGDLSTTAQFRMEPKP